MHLKMPQNPLKIKGFKRSGSKGLTNTQYVCYT